MIHDLKGVCFLTCGPGPEVKTIKPVQTIQTIQKAEARRIKQTHMISLHSAKARARARARANQKRGRGRGRGL